MTGQEKKSLVLDRWRRRVNAPSSAQDSIPYRQMYSSGICLTEDGQYNKTLRFYDINYQLALNEDKNAIFGGWCSFLNYFDSSIHVQLSFVNQHVDFSDFQRQIEIPDQKDRFNDIRREYAQMLRNQLSKGTNGLAKTKYITFGMGFTGGNILDIKTPTLIQFNYSTAAYLQAG